MGGKNSFFRKPLGKDSDASKVAGAVLQPARSAVDASEALSRGDLDKAKNYALGAVTSVNPITMAVNSSSSLRKGFASTGFTDQFVQMADYSNKLSSGRNLNWNEIRGFAGGVAETAAYAVGGYYAGSAGGLWGSSAATASSSAASTGYLGASTSFGAPSAGITSSSQFGLSGSGLLTGSQAATSSTGYLGASTSFGSTAANSGAFLSAAKSFGGDALKTIGGAYVQAAVLGSRPQTPGFVGGGSDGQVTSPPYLGAEGQPIQGGVDVSGFLPIVVVGGLIFAAVSAFKG